MKKILFAILAFTALSLTSCEEKFNIMGIDLAGLDNQEYVCWKYTIKNSGIIDGTIYAWDTEYNVVQLLQKVYTLCGGKAIVSYEKTTDTDKESCHSHNEF